MLTIHREQIDAFDSIQRRQFEDELVEYLRQFAPKLSEIAGETGVRDAIRLGIDKADEYGLTNRGPTRLYLELMFTLGSGFDTDPQLPWAHRVLTDPSIATQMSRADFLYEATNRYMDRVLGPGNEHALNALRQLQVSWYGLEASAPPDIESRMFATMELIYPEKFQYLATDNLHMLVRRGLTLAREHGITSNSGRSLFVGLMFGFGHGIFSDPLYPWVAATLRHRARSDPNERANRLLQKTKLYVDRMLQHLETK
jgi:hypothetical protein